METPLNDHNLLRKMLEDVQPGWEGHVLAGNCEYAEGEGDPDKINAASRLYALWERQEKERREDLSCDTEHAESEEEVQEEEPDDVMPTRKTCWAELGTHFHDCWRWRRRVIQELPNSV